ncbi:unnamed protein product [Peniophora sp. CBMAI 1063]|nr:unnamed protein product [Peniophora sp. CBMAI 1063]
MVKAPPKPQDISRRDLRALKILQREGSGGSTSSAINTLLSPTLNAQATPEVASQERGSPARRRLLLRAHKPGGRKKPIVVLPDSSESRSAGRPGVRPPKRSQKDELGHGFQERADLVSSCQNRSRQMCTSVMTLSSRLDALVLHQKWNRECKNLEERLRTTDVARDLAGVIKEFTDQFSRENLFKEARPTVPAQPHSTDSGSVGDLSAIAVFELLSSLALEVASGTVACEHHSTASVDNVSDTLQEHGDIQVWQEEGNTTWHSLSSLSSSSSAADILPTGSGALHVSEPDPDTVIHHPPTPHVVLPADIPSRTYYQELMVAALKTAQAHSSLSVTDLHRTISPAQVATVFKGSVLFSRSDERESTVHLLEGKGCSVHSTARTTASTTLPSPFLSAIDTLRTISGSTLRSTWTPTCSLKLPFSLSPRMATGSPKPYSELPPSGELFIDGRVLAPKRRRAVRLPTRAQEELYMYTSSDWQDSDQLDTAPSPGCLYDHGDPYVLPISADGGVRTTNIGHPIQLSNIHIYTTSVQQSLKTTARHAITDEVRTPPQAYSRSPSARQRFATWSSGFAEAYNPRAEGLESVRYADNLPQCRERQHSTGLSLLGKVWRW